MNPPNPSGGAPLINKLILLVLSGIFICLMMLVIRAFERPRAVAPNVAVSVTSASETEPAPEAVSLVAPKPSSRRPAASTSRTPVINVTTQPGASEATEEPLTVSQTIVLPPPVGPRVNSSRSSGGGPANVVGGPLPNSFSIAGTITLQGTPKPEIPIDLGPSCGKFAPPATTRHYVVGPDGGLANVFVYIADAKRQTVPGPGPLLDQVGCMYEPYVLGVGVNQKFGIRNSDPEMHNVHAIPKSNKEFNFAQASGSAVALRSFDKPELLVRLKCDIHPWMFAYIGVVPQPWFAVSDKNGIYQLPQGLPAGRYHLTAVHLKAGTQVEEIVMEESHPLVVNFQFTVPSDSTPQTTQVVREGR